MKNLKEWFVKERIFITIIFLVFVGSAFTQSHYISSFFYFLLTEDEKQSYGIVIHRTYNYNVNFLKDSHNYTVVLENKDTVTFQGQYELAEKDTIPMLISKNAKGFSMYNGDQYVFENSLIFCLHMFLILLVLGYFAFRKIPPEGPDLLNPDDFK